jgi:hypothetical protein
MATDQKILEDVLQAFAAEPRPQYFTNYKHCDECAEHNDLLSSRDRDDLQLEDVNNAGWDPICFVTTEGFRYYMPSLVRLALESAQAGDWYLPQFLFHLIGDGPQNRRVACCAETEKQSIVAFLWHILESRQELIARYEIEDDLQQALEIWSEKTPG